MYVHPLVEAITMITNTMNECIKKIALISMLVSLLVTIVYSQEKCFRVGLNGGGPSEMFLNKFTTFRQFSPKPEEIERNAQGYPLKVPCLKIGTNDTIKKVTYLKANAPSPSLYDDSVYVLRWDGDGEFKIDSWKSVAGNRSRIGIR